MINGITDHGNGLSLVYFPIWQRGQAHAAEAQQAYFFLGVPDQSPLHTITPSPTNSQSPPISLLTAANRKSKPCLELRF
jgi:hypothetical protein